MSDINELLICLGSGLALLVIVSGFIGNNFVYIEVPLFGKVPFGLLIAVGVSLYGCFGLIILGVGQVITSEFSLNNQIRLILGICSTITSYYFGRIILNLFYEVPYKSFCDRAIGLTATVRYVPRLLPTAKPGDALIRDRQEKITQLVTIYLADWATETDLQVNDSVLIVDYLPNRKAFLVIKAGGIDELHWQNR